MLFSAKPDVTLTISDGDLVDLMTGKLNSQKAFFQGKLKVGSHHLPVKPNNPQQSPTTPIKPQ